jgi:hypothetical protein
LPIRLWKGSAGSIMKGGDLKLKTICVTINTYKYSSKIYVKWTQCNINKKNVMI